MQNRCKTVSVIARATIGTLFLSFLCVKAMGGVLPQTHIFLFPLHYGCSRYNGVISNIPPEAEKDKSDFKVC